jgi:hypothetical protein
MSSKPKREDVCTQSSKDFCTVVVIVNQVAEFGRMKYSTVFQVLIIAALTVALFVNSKPLDGLLTCLVLFMLGKLLGTTWTDSWKSKLGWIELVVEMPRWTGTTSNLQWTVCGYGFTKLNI